jgi:hypothetical protein
MIVALTECMLARVSVQVRRFVNEAAMFVD